MSKQFLSVQSEDSIATNKKLQMIKTFSFTTDDDDGRPVTEFKSISNHDKLMSINSPSIDSVNVEDELSEASAKIKRRKSRQRIDLEDKIENTKRKIKTTPWYKKFDWSKPILFIGLLIFLYLTWTKKDVWIPRLLTSNTRIHRSIVTREADKADDLASPLMNTPSTVLQSSSTDSPKTSTPRQDNIEDSEHNNDHESTDEKTNDENDNDSIISSKPNSGQKLSLRTRRTKMRFGQENKKKKHHHSKDEPSDDDLEETNNSQEPIKIIEPNASISPLESHSSKKHRRELIHHENFRKIDAFNSGLRLSTYDDITEQLRKNLESRSRDRNFLATISKNTGLNKNKLYRFIYKKDYQIINLQTFISLLDTFNLMFLIVPK